MKEEVKIDEQPTLAITSPEYAAKFWTAVSASDGVPVKLPSGVTVKMRQYPLHEMLLQGRLPKRLQAAAVHVYNEGAGALDVAAAAENIAFMDAVLTYCVVAPQIYDGETPASADAISVHAIPLRDRLRMFTWAMGDARISAEIIPFSDPMTP